MLQNRLISAGLDPVLRHTEKSCIASHYRQFFKNLDIVIVKSIPELLAQIGRRF